jgi:hypothetical protein
MIAGSSVVKIVGRSRKIVRIFTTGGRGFLDITSDVILFLAIFVTTAVMERRATTKQKALTVESILCTE